MGVTYISVKKDMAPALKCRIFNENYFLKKPSDINGNGPGIKSSSGTKSGMIPITSVTLKLT